MHCRNLTRSPAVLLSLFSACPLTGQRDSITMSNWKFLPNFHPFVATKKSSRQTSSKHVWPGSSEGSGSEDTKDDIQSSHNADWCLATRKMSETVLSAVSCLKVLQILITAAGSRYLLYEAFSRRKQLRFQVTSNFDKRQVVSVTVFEISKSIGEGNIFYPKGKKQCWIQKLIGSLVVSYTKKSGWYCSAIVNFSAQKDRNVRQPVTVFGIK